MIQIVRSVKLMLMAHPDNELDSEFADRISSLEELDETLEKIEPIFHDSYGTPVVAGDIKWNITSTECEGFTKNGLLIYDGYVFSNGDIIIHIWSETNPSSCKSVGAFKIKLK